MRQVNLLLKEINPGLNHRGSFDPESMKELVESVKTHGVLQPIIVRLIPKEWAALSVPPEKWTIVCGGRRFRAALTAGLTIIPAVVRDLTDAEAEEIQMVENLQREGLHPLDEAEGYWKLMKNNGYTAEDVAARVGKSRTYIYSRLKLADLPEKAKKALRENRLSPSIALLVARIPDPDLAEEACKEIIKPNYTGEGMSYRAARNHIEHHYMLDLKTAPFSTKDASLDPKAGACTTCPKRTGNQAELFEDVKNVDVCIDPPCFENKKKLHQARLLARAKEKGQTVLPAAECKRLFPHEHSLLSDNSSFVDLEDTCYETDDYKPWAKLLGKHTPEPVLAIDPKGDIHRLVNRKEAYEALKKAGHKVPKLDEKYAKDRKAEREKAKKEKLQEAAVLKAVVAAAEEKGHDWLESQGPANDLTRILGFLAGMVIRHNHYDPLRELAGRHPGFEYIKKKAPEGGFYNPYAGLYNWKKWDEYISGMDGAKTLGFIVEVLFWGEDTRKLAFSYLKIDPKAIKADPPPPKQAPKKQKGLRCVVCGCTEARACEGGCAWIFKNLDLLEGVCTTCGNTKKGKVWLKTNGPSQSVKV